MSEWILSIVGIVFIGVLIEIIMPDGKLNSFIKHIFGLFVLFVVVCPVADFCNKTENSFNEDIVLDSNYLYNVNLNKVEEIERTIIETFESKGINFVSVIVNANVFSDEFKIDSIYVDVANAKYDLDKDDLYVVIRSTLVEMVDILEENIKIYG